MRTFAALAILSLTVSASRPAIDPELVNTVNKIQTSWTAEVSERFADHTIEQARALMGSVVGPNAIKLPEKKVVFEGDVPTDFDSRTGFPKCKNVIGHVRDQANCGSCWAVGSTEAFNSRLCIASNGQFQTLLSAQDTTSCCDVTHCFSMGCNGGQPSAAWSWFVNTGVVTGGDYGDKSTCRPYALPKCAHHVSEPGVANCTAETSTPQCTSSCTVSSYGTPYQQDKRKAKSSYSISGEANIKAEIMKNGPVTTAFTVYEDFLGYKSGVYHHVSGSELGGHAVAIIGWGEESGEKYWLVKNSWNNGWGDGGLFKMSVADDCGMAGAISAGEA